MVIVQEMSDTDIEVVATIHHEAFPHDTECVAKSRAWIKSKFRGQPINRIFVARGDGEVIGYVLWAEMGGFRRAAVLELEQIAVLAAVRAEGVGTRLIDESLSRLCMDLARDNRNLKLVEVTTGATNEAQRLYGKTLGATVACTKQDFFEDDEIVMIARSREIQRARACRGLRALITR